MRGIVRAVAVCMAILVSSATEAAEPGRLRVAIRLDADVGHPGDTVGVEISVVDAGGAAFDAPVALDVDAGKAAPPERVRTGVYRSSIAVPLRLPLSRNILVLARTGAGSSDASLKLGPGPAAELRLEGPQQCAEDADGCPIEATAADAHGNPAAEIPEATPELGRVSAAGLAEPGRWVIVYHPPRVDRERTVEVAVQLGQLRRVQRMRLTPARTRFGFAPAGGIVRQEGRHGFAAAAQVVGERLVGSGWVLGAGLEGAWWSVSRGGEASGLHVSTDRTQVSAAMLVLAERSLGGRATATLSLGGGAVRVASAAHVEGQPGVSDSGWAPTVRATAGLGYRFSFGMPFLEARAAWVGDAHLVTDPGATWPLFLLVGYRLDVR